MQSMNIETILDLNRESFKLNYRIHTEVIKEKLLSPELTPRPQAAYTYVNGADMLNIVLEREQRQRGKDGNLMVKGNMQDVATLNLLLVLANHESY